MNKPTLWVVETFIDKRMKPHMALGLAQVFTTHGKAAAYVQKQLSKGYYCSVIPARMARD